MTSSLRATAAAGFAWVGAQARPVPGGALWCEDTTPYDDLYCGTAGVLLAAAEARAAGLDVSSVAELALGRLEHVVAADDASFETPGDPGLFTGWTGIVAALHAWSALDLAERLARRQAERLVQGATPTDLCTDVISGDAGLLLALAPFVHDATVADALGIVADRLVAVAEPGPQWRMVEGYHILMPNFSHGTAGVGFALAVAGDALDRPDLRDAAHRAAETLLAIAGDPPGWAVPLAIPREHRPAVAFGWCHGPTGTLRLFARLAGADPRYADAVDRCLTALVDSGIPERKYPGYWDNLGRCCGTAGVGSVLLDRYAVTGDPALLAFADRLADDVVTRAIPAADGLFWSHTEHTATPPDLPPQPGFMQGVAGIASWLARLAAAHDGHVATADLGVTPNWV